MKKLLLMSLLIVLLSASNVSATWCGIKPIKPIRPIGCSDLVAVCVCDSSGFNCWWQWQCIPY